MLSLRDDMTADWPILYKEFYEQRYPPIPCLRRDLHEQIYEPEPVDNYEVPTSLIHCLSQSMEFESAASNLIKRFLALKPILEKHFGPVVTDGYIQKYPVCFKNASIRRIWIYRLGLTSRIDP